MASPTSCTSMADILHGQSYILFFISHICFVVSHNLSVRGLIKAIGFVGC